MQAAKLMRYLLEKGLDTRIMNNIRLEFLRKDQNEKGFLNTDDFIKIFRTITKQDSIETEQKIRESLEDPKLGIIKYPKFSEFVDFYHYLPMQIKKDRNLSNEIYSILTSNKFANFGEKYETDQELMGLKEWLDFLWLKIEERFHKVAPAFRYFDMNNNGTIHHKEFEIGVNQLSARFTREQIKKMFEYIDTDHNGQIEYIEFWELCEECRRGIDPYKIDKNLKRGETLTIAKKHKTRELSMTSSFKYDSGEDDIISTSLASFKKKKKYMTVLPSELNKNYTYGIKTPIPENIGSVMTYEPLNEYLKDSKIRENKINSRKTVMNIFKNAKPTHSSSIRDKELKHQRIERNEKFMAEHLGHLRIKEQKKSEGANNQAENEKSNKS